MDLIFGHFFQVFLHLVVTSGLAASGEAAPGWGGLELKETLSTKRAVGVGTPARVREGVEIFEVAEGDLHFAVTLLELSRRRSWRNSSAAARGSRAAADALDRRDSQSRRHRTTLPSRSDHLDVRRDAGAEFAEERRPVKALVDQAVQNFGAVDDLARVPSARFCAAVTFGSTFAHSAWAAFNWPGSGSSDRHSSHSKGRGARRSSTSA